MKFLAVPVPLFNNEMNVMAYSFRFQKGDNLFSQEQSSSKLDDAFGPPLLKLVNDVGVEALAMDKPIFIPISHISLLLDLETQCGENPKNITFVIDKNFEAEDVYLERIKRFKKLGYSFASHGKIDWSYHAPVIALCDYAFVDNTATDPEKARDYLRSLNKRIKIIVSEIENANSFRNVRYSGFDLFEGPFYRLPLSTGQNTVNPLKVNYIQLLNIVGNDDFELDEVSKIIRQDTALAIALLKLVNSIGLTQKVNSIKHAAAMLGQKELKKWITTAVTKMLSADKPNEITKLSLTRAKFAENLAPFFEMAINSESLFLTGLFSVLNVILDMPMVSALSVVQVSDSIKDALLFRRGDYYKVLEFIMQYEMADWVSASRTMILNGMEPERVSKAYFEALLWYSSMISMTDEVLAPEEVEHQQAQ